MWKTCGIWMAALALATADDFSELAHPRLWFPKAAETRLRETLAKDPLAARLQDAAVHEARRLLKERTCRYEIPDGKRLLGESRRALHNIMHCAWAWRTTGSEEFRLRALAELEAACALKDWNPSHFLDTAEMAAAVATGYDWLHDSLTPAQRAMCEQAILEKALKPAKAVYDKGGWWSKPGNNWSQVCGAGIALAAAATAGRDQGLAGPLFTKGLDLVERCSEFYQPDGMYPEGPGYWHYGTNYHVMMLAACAPLGRSFKDDPILKRAGDSIMHLTSPTRLNYNFADGGAGRETPSPAQCWLAGHYRDATQSAHVRALFARALDESKGRFRSDRYFPLSILWLPPAPPENTRFPNGAVFHGEQAMALFRGGWSPDAAWFAIKGGTPAASHGHMDAGSFCYDADGERWIHDLGAENYNLPAYFGNKRWTYYRLQNRSHNTLEINGQLQNAKSKPCPLVSSSLTGNPLAASFDLSAAYQGSAAKVVRSARFDTASGRVRLTDEISRPAGDIIWRAFTDAKTEISGDRVTLRKNGKHITLRRLSPAGTWSLAPATPPTAAENPNKGFQALTLTLPAADPTRIEIEILP